MNRNDSGTFICTADNGFGEPQSQTVYVNVICKYESLTQFNNEDIGRTIQVYLCKSAKKRKLLRKYYFRTELNHT